MFTAVYRWRLKENSEDRFTEGWRRRTKEIYRKCGSLGSRLHKAEDGTWVGIALWTDKETWEAISSVPVDDTEAVEMMRDSIEESLPSMLMEVTEDLWQTKQFES